MMEDYTSALLQPLDLGSLVELLGLGLFAKLLDRREQLDTCTLEVLPRNKFRQ